MNLAKLEGFSVETTKAGFFGRKEKLFFSSGHVIVDLDDIRKIVKVRDHEGIHATKIYYKCLPDYIFSLLKIDPAKLARMMAKKGGKFADDTDILEGYFMTQTEEGEEL